MSVTGDYSRHRWPGGGMLRRARSSGSSSSSTPLGARWSSSVTKAPLGDTPSPPHDLADGDGRSGPAGCSAGTPAPLPPGPAVIDGRTVERGAGERTQQPTPEPSTLMWH
jgi:hypothetical protein